MNGSESDRQKEDRAFNAYLVCESGCSYTSKNKFFCNRSHNYGCKNQVRLKPERARCIEQFNDILWLIGEAGFDQEVVLNQRCHSDDRHGAQAENKSFFK